jgi:hypothetical protein
MANSTVYRLKRAELRTGDIMLCTHQTAKSSKVIRWKTNSRFSHAAISHDPPEFLEAIPKGVCRVNVSKFFFRKLEDVCILRAATALAPEKLRAAIDEALRHLGNAYWKTGAIATQTPWAFRSRESAAFCSHLVSLAYQRAGVELLMGVAPERTVPGALERSTQLIDVTSEVFEPIALPIAQLWLVPYGEGKSTSPHQEEIAMGRRVCNQVNAWLKSNGYAEQENFIQLLNVLRDEVRPEQRPQMDAIFLEALESTGYLQLVEKKYPQEHESFHASKILRAELARGGLDGEARRYLLADYEELLASYENAIEDLRFTRDWYENAWRFRGLETFRRLALFQTQACETNRRLEQEVRACCRILRQ